MFIFWSGISSYTLSDMHRICLLLIPLTWCRHYWFGTSTSTSIGKWAQSFMKCFFFCPHASVFFLTWVLHSCATESMWPRGVIDAAKQEGVSWRGVNTESGHYIYFHTLSILSHFLTFLFLFSFFGEWGHTQRDAGNSAPSLFVVTK